LSAKAAARLEAHNFTEVYKSEGIAEFKAANIALVTGESTAPSCSSSEGSGPGGSGGSGGGGLGDESSAAVGALPRCSWVAPVSVALGLLQARLSA